MTKFSEVAARAHQLQQELRAEGYDDADVLASIESETDLLRVFDRIAERVDQDTRSAVCAAERARRLKARADKNSEFLGYLMRTMGVEDRIERPTATVYYRDNPGSLDIDGEVPAEWMTSVPDKLRIKAALKKGEVIEHCTLTQSRSLLVKTT